MHNYCTPHIIKENFENFLIHRYNYILLSQVYCVWQVVKTPTIILNNPVHIRKYYFESRRLRLKVYHVWNPEKELHILAQLTIYQRLIPPSPFPYPLWDVSTFLFSFLPLRGGEKSVFPVFFYPPPRVLLSYYILTPISSLTSIYSYTFGRLSLPHTKPQIPYSFSFFIPHTTSVDEAYFSENPRAIKHSNGHNSLQRLEF